MFTGNIDELKRDLDLLYSLGIDQKAKQILVRRIEHTSTSQQRLKGLSQSSIDGYEKCIEWLSVNYPKVVFTVPELKDCFRGGNNEYFIEAEEHIARQKKIISQLPKDVFINLISPVSGYDYFTKAFKDYPNVQTNLVKNHLYGGSVTVAGLLNHGDIIEQFHPKRNDVMFLPEEMYNSEGRDLKGEKMEVLEQYYNAKIYLT